MGSKQEHKPGIGQRLRQVLGQWWGDRPPLQHLAHGFVVGLGYLLSPLSWWNDLVFNLPIAYGFAWVVTWGHRDWLGPGVLLGYWLSNVAGLVMMQWGVVDWVRPQNPGHPIENAAPNPPEVAPQPAQQSLSRRDWLWSLGSATLYSLAIAALVYGHWLELPEGLLP